MKTYVSIILVLIVWFGGCKVKDETEGPKPTPTVLLSYELLTAAPISAQTLDTLLFTDANFNDGVVQGFTNYNVNVYKVIYRTTYKGNEIRASGLCVIPDTSEARPILSYQHGTILLEVEAPSHFTNIYSATVEMAVNVLLGSCGYICSVPDYPGYGESGDLLHPYHHAESLTTACVDMLAAVKELCDTLDVAYENRYFLTGYSEGGHATLALQRKIERDHAAEYPLMAVSAGAGASALVETARHFMGQPILYVPAYSCFLYLAYNDVYDWNRDLSEIFRSPYKERIEGGLFDGGYSYWDVNGLLSYNTDELFTASFIANVVGNGENTLKEALLGNSLHDGWVPIAPIRLYHGTADQTVPAFNSQKAYQLLLGNGASSVEYVVLTGHDHATATIPWAKGTIQWFATY